LRAAKRTAALAGAVSAALVLTACGGGFGNAPKTSSAPQNFQVTAGDGQAVVTWTQDSSLQYWIFDAASGAININNWFNEPLAQATTPAYSPQSVTNLTNGTQYAFIMNSTKNGGPAGPTTDSIAVIPRLAGGVSSPGNTYSGWTVSPQTLPSNITFRALGYNGAVFLAAGDAGNVFLSLPYDGAHWNASYNGTPVNSTSVTASNLNGVVWNSSASVWVAVGDNNTEIYSFDGVNWTNPGTIGNAISGTVNLHAISTCYNGANQVTYVAAGDNGTILTSVDGINWTNAVSNTSANLYAATSLFNVCVVAGNNGTILQSTDTVNWGQPVGTVPSGASAYNFRSVAAGYLLSANTYYYVAVGENGAVVSSQQVGSNLNSGGHPGENPITFTTAGTIPGSPNLNAVYFGSRFVAVGDGGAIVYSDNAVNWNTSQVNVPISQNLNALVFSNGIYDTVGAAGFNATSR
jgi:hypothetical protein